MLQPSLPFINLTLISRGWVEGLSIRPSDSKRRRGEVIREGSLTNRERRLNRASTKGNASRTPNASAQNKIRRHITQHKTNEIITRETLGQGC